MKTKLENLFKYFIFSAGNENRGASGKKIIAYCITICVLAMHASWLKNAHEHNDYIFLTEILKTDFGMILILYGINVTDKKLNGTSDKPVEENKKADA